MCVCGSDRSPSLITNELESAGIPISFDQSGAFLQSEHDKSPFDWFIYTAALPENHPELVLARKLGIKTSKRDELLAQIIADKPETYRGRWHPRKNHNNKLASLDNGAIANSC